MVKADIRTPLRSMLMNHDSVGVTLAESWFKKEKPNNIRFQKVNQ